MLFTYWFVRFYPHHISDEFVNIAVIVGADNARWHVQELNYKAKASAFHVSPGLPEIWIREFQQAALVREELVTDSPMSISEFTDRARRLNGTVRLSPPNSIVANSAVDGAITILNSLLVSTTRKRNFHTRRYVRLVVHDLFFGTEGISAGNNAFESAGLIGLDGQPLNQTIDLSVGHNKVQLVTDSWGMAATSEQDFLARITASCWRYDKIRAGEVKLQEHLPPSSKLVKKELEFASNVKIVPIYKAPETDRHKRFLELALPIWEESEVEPVSMDDLDPVLDQAAVIAQADQFSMR